MGGWGMRTGQRVKVVDRRKEAIWWGRGSDAQFMSCDVVRENGAFQK